MILRDPKDKIIVKKKEAYKLALVLYDRGCTLYEETS